jgi:phage-related protein (TIGR01555 family)
MPADKPTWGGRRVGPDGKPLAGRPRKAKPEGVPAEPKAPAPKNLDLTRLAAMLPEIIEASRQHARTHKRTAEANPFQIPWFPKAALPPKNYQMAMDSMPVFADAAMSWLAGGILNSAASEALLFPGYTYLSQLAQQPDFRNMAETIADDATRKWIKFEVTGNEEETEKRQAQDFADPDGSQERRERRLKEKGKTDKVKALNDYMQKLALQKIFFDLCRDDGFFGRTHLYLNFGDNVGMNSPELKTPIGDGRDALSRSKVGKDRPLRTVKTIEPLWAYPTTYNAQNPLAPDWYDPTVWYVMGTEIHASRLLRFIGRPVPDILKPAYAFGGVSLSQLISPSVDIWIRTRNSVSELVHSFSVMVLSTNLETMIQPGTATSLLARATLFNALRDNQNLMIVNKGTEDFQNVSAPIAGLDDLQAQAQEHVASTGRVPLVKYTGLQPKGLNASAEGEIAVYDDTIMAYQNRFIRPNLTTVFNFMQLSLWGEIDPEITFEFEPLRVMTEKERSEKQKADAERDGMRLDQGAISSEEVRKIIIGDPDLPYTDLNPDEMPEPPDDGMGAEGDPEGAIGKGGKPPAEGGSGEEPGGKNTAARDELFDDPDKDTDYWLRSTAEQRRERERLERERRLPPVILSTAEGEEAEGAEE